MIDLSISPSVKTSRSLAHRFLGDVDVAFDLVVLDTEFKAADLSRQGDRHQRSGRMEHKVEIQGGRSDRWRHRRR
jgi:hypothetical protein